MSLEQKSDHFEDDNIEDKSTTMPVQRPRHSPIPRSQIPTQSLKLPRRDSQQHSVAFQKPSIVTTFSYTSDRELAFDNSALKYLVQPPVRADLGYRYSTWAKRPEEKGRLDNLLRALARSRAVHPPFQGVVSWRGVMCKYAASFEALT